MKNIYLYFLTFLIFSAIDILWLTVISKNLYSTYLSHLLAENPRLVPAVIFYLVFVVGIIVFAVLPGYMDKSIIKTILLGALFGALSYATYDLTNLATLKDWPILITVVDILWGSTVSVLTSVAGYYIAGWIGI